MANKIKRTVGFIGRFAAQVVIGMVFFPIALVSAILLPKVSAKAFNLSANFVTEPIITGYILVFSALPMKWWKKHMLDKVGGVKTYTVDWQRNYYFATRTERSAKSLSLSGCRAVLKDKRLAARDVDNILERTDAKEIIQSLTDIRQAKIYKIYSDNRLINMMSDEACHIATDLTGDYVDFVKSGMKLEPDEWYELIEASKEDFDKCLLMQTPPESIVKMLLTNPDFSLEAEVCIKRYGLSAKLIQSLDEKQLEGIKEPLKEFSQRTFLQRTHSLEELEKFFVQEGKICVDAQKVMNVEQYKVFHKSQKLSPEVIEHFLAKEDMRMAKLIFSFEEELSDKAKAIIEASAALKDLSMK